MTLCALSWVTVLVLLVYAIVGGLGWAFGQHLFSRMIA